MNNNMLLEEQKRRFQEILEFTYRGHVMKEDGEDPNAMPPQDGGMPGGDMGGAPQDAGTMPGGDMGGGDPNAMPPQDGGMPGGDMSGGDPNAMPPQDGGMPGGDMGGAPQGPEGFNPQEDPMGGDISQGDFDAPGPDDDVVDISELTDAQESTEDAIKEIGGKFDKVMKYLGQWEEMIKSNNEKIEDLKSEFEKRNPTQIEKLGMQTANSYPFNVTPDEYWKEKAATSNYRTEDDDNGKEQGQYTITKNDIDGTTDWKGIADSLDDDAIYHPTLKNTMGYGL